VVICFVLGVFFIEVLGFIVMLGFDYVFHI